ncbi:MAG: hypothetical protein U5L96_14130 [Owenweeksia sp.]|nr:hypothetical protein [Owenweeksia sp.]
MKLLPGYFERPALCDKSVSKIKGTGFRYEPHLQYDCNTPAQVFSVEENILKEIKSFESF